MDKLRKCAFSTKPNLFFVLHLIVNISIIITAIWCLYNDFRKLL